MAKIPVTGQNMRGREERNMEMMPHRIKTTPSGWDKKREKSQFAKFDLEEKEKTINHPRAQLARLWPGRVSRSDNSTFFCNKWIRKHINSGSELCMFEVMGDM